MEPNVYTILNAELADETVLEHDIVDRLFKLKVDDQYVVQMPSSIHYFGEKYVPIMFQALKQMIRDSVNILIVYNNYYGFGNPLVHELVSAVIPLINVEHPNSITVPKPDVKTVQEYRNCAIRNSVFLTIIGIDDDCYLDIVPSGDCKGPVNMRNFNHRDFRGTFITSTADLSEYLSDFNYDLIMNKYHCQFFIYRISYITSEGLNEHMDLIDVKGFGEITTHLQVQLFDVTHIGVGQKEFFQTCASNRLVDVLKRLLEGKDDKKICAIMKLDTVNALQQGQFLFNVLINLRNNALHLIDPETHQMKEELDRMKSKLRSAQRRINYLYKAHAKDIQRVEKKARKEIVDKLFETHNEKMANQNKAQKQLLDDTRDMYKSNCERLERYYLHKIEYYKNMAETPSSSDVSDACDKEIKSLMEKIVQLQEINNDLNAQKAKQEENLRICQKRLANVQNVLVGVNIVDQEMNVTSNQDTQNLINDINNLIINKDPDRLNRVFQENALKDRIADLENQLEFHKNNGLKLKLESEPVNNDIGLQIQLNEKNRLLNEANEEIAKLKVRLVQVESLREHLGREMCVAEYISGQQARESNERILSLLEQNAKLKQDITNMEARHMEQFRRYERLIQKEREAVKVHKREVEAIRQHFVIGHPSPLARTPSQELTPKTPQQDPETLSVLHLVPPVTFEHVESVAGSRSPRDTETAEWSSFRASTSFERFSEHRDESEQDSRTPDFNNCVDMDHDDSDSQITISEHDSNYSTRSMSSFMTESTSVQSLVSCSGTSSDSDEILVVDDEIPDSLPQFTMTLDYSDEKL